MEEKCTVLLNDIVYHNVAENADCNPVSMQVLTSTNFASHLKNQLDTCDGFGERLLKIGKITLSENSYLWNNETRLSLERINRTFNRNLLATIEKCAGIFYNASAGLLEAQSCDFEGDFSRLCSVERNMTIAGRQGGRQGGSQGGKLDKFEGGIKDGLNIIKDIPGAGYAIDSAKKTVGDWIFGMGEKKTKDVTIGWFCVYKSWCLRFDL